MTYAQVSTGWSGGMDSISRRTSLASTESGFISNCSSGLSSPDLSPTEKQNTKLPSSNLALIEPVSFGAPGKLDFRTLLTMNGRTRLISPWRDIQLFWPNGLLSCVCKSPAGTWLRYEVAVNEPLHPLRLTKAPSAFKAYIQKQLEMGFVMKRSRSRGWQRVRSHLLQSLRPAHFVDNTPWNIGMLPQTWGNSGKLGCASRSTPDGTLGIVEIGHAKSRKTGDVYSIKPLGAYSVHSEDGETSWKIIGIDIEDPIAELLNDIEDVKTVLPGITEMVAEWLETHVGTYTESASKFVIKGPYQLAVAVNRIIEHHKAWKGANEATMVHPPLPIVPGTEVDSKLMEKIWTEFTTKDRRSLLGPVSESNPETLLLHDDSWFGEDGDDLLVDIIQPSDSHSPALEEIHTIQEVEEEAVTSTQKSSVTTSEPTRSSSSELKQGSSSLSGKNEAQPLKSAPQQASKPTTTVGQATSSFSGSRMIEAYKAKSSTPSNQKNVNLASQSNKKSSILSYWFQGRKKKFGLS